MAAAAVLNAKTTEVFKAIFGHAKPNEVDGLYSGSVIKVRKLFSNNNVRKHKKIAV